MGFTAKILASMSKSEQRAYKIELVKLFLDKGAGVNWIARNVRIGKGKVKKVKRGNSI